MPSGEKTDNGNHKRILNMVKITKASKARFRQNPVYLCIQSKGSLKKQSQQESVKISTGSYEFGAIMRPSKF